jgi:hypothetical protein
MPATAADVAKYTNDGVVISTNAALGAAIKAMHPNARDTGTGELEMFFSNPADAQVLLDEKFGYLSRVDPPHELIEVEDTVPFGTTIPVAPIVPSVRIIDDERRLNAVPRLRAYSHNLDGDHFAVEVLG